jgi:adenylate cyclase
MKAVAGLAPRRRHALKLGIIVAFLLIANELGTFVRPDWKLGDAVMRLRPKQRVPSDIVVVGVSAAESRQAHASVIRTIHRSGAKVIGYTVAFEPANNGRFDGILMRAVSQAEPVVLGTLGGEPAEPCYVTPFLFRPERELDVHGARVGLLGYVRDSDQVIRRIRPRLYRDEDEAEPATLPNGRGRVCAGGRQFLGPLSFAHEVALAAREGELPSGVAREADIIDFAGPRGTFPQIPFDDVASGHFPIGFFRDRIVIVGVTTAYPPPPNESPDFWVRRVPVERAMDPVEVDANAVATLLRGAPLRPTDFWTCVLLIGGAALIPFALIDARSRRTMTIIGAFSGITAWLTGSLPAWTDAITWPLTAMILALALALFALMVPRGRTPRADDT